MTRTVRLRHAGIDPQFVNALKALAQLRAKQPPVAYDEQGHIQKPALMMAVGPAMTRIEQMPCFGKFDIQYKTLEVICDEQGSVASGCNEEYDNLINMGWQDLTGHDETDDIRQFTLAAIHTIGNCPYWEQELAEYKSSIKKMVELVNRPKIGCCTILGLILAALVLSGTAIAKCL